MNKLISTLLFVAMALASTAQTTTADQFVQNGEFDKAATAYLEYLEHHPGDSLVSFKLGRTYAGMKMWGKSEHYYRRALQGQFPEGSINYQLARNELEQNHPEKAMELLKSGAAVGMRNYIALKNDPLFMPLHNHPEWIPLMQKVETNTYPCLNSEEYRRFDFWLGSWNVMVNGIKVGENEISRANGGCAIHESYTTYPRDYTGQSINFYDPIEKRWHQHWVGSGGDVTNYYETAYDNGMLQFNGKTLGPTGKVALNRMTFTSNADGSVRQKIEASSDDGSSWSVIFDGHYVRKTD